MISTQQEWETRYQRGETGWDRGQSSPALWQWLDQAILTPCRILIPGCGRGYEVAELTRRGFEVTALDIAPSAVAEAKRLIDKNGLKAEVLHADVLKYRPAMPFDAIYEQTCLCALQPERWAAYETRLFDWLRPKGQLLAMFMQTGTEGGPPFHCDLDAMNTLFDASRWHWPQDEPMRINHPAGLHELGIVLTRRDI